MFLYEERLFSPIICECVWVAVKPGCVDDYHPCVGYKCWWASRFISRCWQNYSATSLVKLTSRPEAVSSFFHVNFTRSDSATIPKTSSLSFPALVIGKNKNQPLTLWGKRKQNVGEEAVVLKQGKYNLAIYTWKQIFSQSVLFGFIPLLQFKDTWFLVKDLVFQQAEWESLWNPFKDHWALVKDVAFSHRDILSAYQCADKSFIQLIYWIFAFQAHEWSSI